MGKWKTVFFHKFIKPHNGILLSNNKEYIDTLNNVVEPEILRLKEDRPFKKSRKGSLLSKESLVTKIRSVVA